MTPDTCIIVNPASGRRGGEEKIAELHAALQRFPDRFTLRIARRAGELDAAARQAVRDGFHTVAAAGGDGTINAVAARLADSDTRLGILPVGTFNYLARRLRIPLAVPDALAVLHDGCERSIDLGEVNGRIFFNNASLGAYATILRQREAMYRRWGRSQLAAHGSVLIGLIRFHDPLAVTLSVDGTVSHHHSPMVFVASNAYQLEHLGLAGGDCIARRQLALFLAPNCHRLDLLRLAFGLRLARLQPERDFRLFCGADILVQTRRRHRTIARDGERERMAGPFRFRLRRDALRVVVPGDVS